MDLVDAVEKVAGHMQAHWAHLITDDAIGFFRRTYRKIVIPSDYAGSAAAYRLVRDATDSEINDAVPASAARHGHQR